MPVRSEMSRWRRTDTKGAERHMKKNGINYPGERAPRRSGTVEQPGYTGKNYYAVQYAGQSVNVHAQDENAALFWAAKHWGYSFKRAEYHQCASAQLLHYKPGGLLG